MIAVNLVDLELLDSKSGAPMTAMLLADFVGGDPPTVWVDKSRMDSAAVILDGPAASEPNRLLGLIELLQTVLGPRKIGRKVRVYQKGPRGGWKQVKSEDLEHSDVAQLRLF